MVTMNGLLKSEMQREIHKINDYFLDLENVPSSIDLYTGLSGNLLLMTQNFLWTEDRIYLEKIDSYLAFSMLQIEKSLNQNWNFSLALSGWGWVLNYLSQHEITDSEIVLGSINGYLGGAMANLLMNDNYDQLNGAIRIGRYFIAQGYSGQLTAIISYLNRIKLTVGDQIIWQKKKEGAVSGYYDLGLAHGAAGILHFLATCLENQVCEEECSALIDGTIRFILSNIQDYQSCGSYFPSMVSAEEHSSGRMKQTHSRLAWCYGDLGIWYTLYTSSVLTKNQPLQMQALAGLKTLASRRSFEETLVVDAGFCHGSSGIAHIFNKIWVTTQDVVFAEARDFWLRETITYGINKYEFLVGNFDNRTFKSCDTLLEGLIGVVLTYNSCLDPRFGRWDECLLLS